VARWLFALLLLSPQAQETIAEIRVHGNVATPDDEVRRLAGIEIGAPVTADTVAIVADRLRSTKRFQRVDVLKRFASIDDLSRIVLVIVVDEGPVNIERTADPDRPVRVVKKRGPNLMFLPLLSAEDGYGLIYGGQIGIPNPAGRDSRLSFPLTWGGDKRAAAEFEKDYDAGRTRLIGTAAINRRTHPYFDRDEDRGRLTARIEREIAHAVRIGATSGWQHVSFLDATDSFFHAGADVVVDTRLDPVLAYNAVYARASWEHLDFRSGGSNNRSELEGRGYIGLVGQTVLVVRGLRDDASDPLPVYLEPMLGGLANLRGFKAGTTIGDTLVATSAELRVPLTSPLKVGKIGVSAFVDAGVAYSKSERLADQTWKKGIGGGFWASAAIVRFNVAVAHGIGAGTRVHIGGTVSF